MPHTLLVGLDGSPASARAEELAIRWASAGRESILGVAVVDAPGICAPEAVPLGAGAFKHDRDVRRLADARQRVQAFATRCADGCGAAGVPCETLILEGSPAEALVLESQRADLVVLGQQTFFSFETSDQPDGTLHEVVRNAPRPVVVAPPVLPAEGPVLVAYDGSVQAARTLQAFEGIRLPAWGERHLVAVEADREKGEQWLTRAAIFLRRHESVFQSRVVPPEGSPAATILAEAQRIGAGLIVMGAYGQSTLREFFFGSVTSTLLRESTVPLFLFH